jgi:hypothetical protein
MSTFETKNLKKNTPRLLGIAFLLQGVASAIGALALIDPLIVPGNITETMTNIAKHAFQMRAGILLQMITAIGIVMLGAMLFQTLKGQNLNIALIGFGLYVLEASVFAASRIFSFALLYVSQESVIAGHPEFMQLLGKLFYASAEFGDFLHMLAFGLGATLFYFLFLKSGFLPRWWSIFGLIAASIALLGTMIVLLGINLPLIIFLPNLPFELGTGLWLLFKGIPGRSESK